MSAQLATMTTRKVSHQGCGRNRRWRPASGRFAGGPPLGALVTGSILAQRWRCRKLRSSPPRQAGGIIAWLLVWLSSEKCQVGIRWRAQRKREMRYLLPATLLRSASAPTERRPVAACLAMGVATSYLGNIHGRWNG